MGQGDRRKVGLSVESPAPARGLTNKAFTLIEVLIAVTISVFIAAAIYWSIVTALHSWGYIKDELILQRVISQIMQELVEGTPDSCGLRDALEVKSAYEDRVEVVFPWVDDTHMAQSGVKVYTLNRHMKPGTGIPICETRFPEEDIYRSIPVAVVDWGKKDEFNKVELPLNVPPGSLLQFIFHPDANKSPDVISEFKWTGPTLSQADVEEGRVYFEDEKGRRLISKNPFGVKVSDFSFRYYDNANNKLSEGGYVNEDRLQLIAGIEIFAEVIYKGRKKQLLNFVNLRNSPARGGSLSLKEGMKINIPDSRHIKTLFLTNISGIDTNDVIQLEARSYGGKSWRLTLYFVREGLAAPLIGRYTVESPTGHTVLAEKIQSAVEGGLNLLSLGTNGLYDYDDDEDVEDFVLLEGDVELKVTKMDIAGAALFVRP